MNPARKKSILPPRRSAPAPRKRSVPVRDRLLQAATKLFARSGFSGTTVDEVVSLAGVNKRMVYHYFENKEDLYREVLAEVYRSLDTLGADVAIKGKDLAAITSQMVRLYFEFLDTNPEFVRLLLWENLNHGKGLKGNGARVAKDSMVNALDQVLQEEINARRIRPGMDARHLLISLLGLCQIYHSHRYTLSRALGMDLSSPKVLQDGIRHVTRLLLEGIKAPA